MSLLLGGYSYGAMVTTLLPPTPTILSNFTKPNPGSVAAEIRLRAAHLARTYLQTFSSTTRPEGNNDIGRGRSPDNLQPPNSTIAIGGEESTPYSRTPSNGRRSVDSSRLRQSLERSRRKLHLSKDKIGEQQTSPPTPESPVTESSPNADLAAIEILPPTTAYLLISPILGPAAGLATMFSAALSRNNGEEKFLTNDTMVVYGDGDVFTSQRKLRWWCEDLRERSANEGVEKFQFCEVEGAGHFWRERGVEEKLRKAAGEWISEAILK